MVNKHFTNIPALRQMSAFIDTSRDKIKIKKAELITTVKTLTFNEYNGFDYTIDILLEPIFWFVDNFSKCVGKVFVFCVVVLTAAVVVIAYWIGLSYWWNRNKTLTVFLLIFGNWILMNIIFHYYKGLTTSPGYPPPGDEILEAASICKKCIIPKPPRTHHCSVCDRCVLAMDHHCPWLDNCVGYFNARYFFLFMVYMHIGLVFVILAGMNIGYVVLWLDAPMSPEGFDEPEIIGFPIVVNESGSFVPVESIAQYDIYNPRREHVLPIPELTDAQKIALDPLKRKAVIFMFFTCINAFIALSVLIYMHARNITKGQTSVESHINESESKRLHQNYKNPYDFGKVKNWKVFLGLVSGRTFLKHVIFPSSHKPMGNGLSWHTVMELNNGWP